MNSVDIRVCKKQTRDTFLLSARAMRWDTDVQLMQSQPFWVQPTIIHQTKVPSQGQAADGLQPRRQPLSPFTAMCFVCRNGLKVQWTPYLLASAWYCSVASRCVVCICWFLISLPGSFYTCSFHCCRSVCLACVKSDSNNDSNSQQAVNSMVASKSCLWACSSVGVKAVVTSFFRVQFAL